jgi:hypothetical protein
MRFGEALRISLGIEYNQLVSMRIEDVEYLFHNMSSGFTAGYYF